MKTISIVAAIGLLLAAVVFFMRDKGSRADLVEARKQIETLSNKVSMAETRVALLSGTTNQLDQLIAKHSERAAGLSNQVAKLSENVKQLQQEHAAIMTDLDKHARKAAAGDVRITELDTELGTTRKTLESRESEIAKLRENLKQSETQTAEFHDRVQKAEADIVRLQLDLNDETALRAQLKRLKHQWPPVGFAKPPAQSVTTTTDKGAQDLTARVDTKATGYYLQMQPDGSVKLVPSYEASGAPR